MVPKYFTDGYTTNLIVIDPGQEDLATISGPYQLESVSVVSNSLFICNEITENGETVVIVVSQDGGIITLPGIGVGGEFIIDEVTCLLLVIPTIPHIMFFFCNF